MFSFPLQQPWGELPLTTANCCPYALIPLPRQHKNSSSLRAVLIAGAQKSGTTWLFNLLKQHQAFAVGRKNPKPPRARSAWPTIKEHVFFNAFHMSTRAFDDYVETFGDQLGKFLLDATPDYLDTPVAACRIRTVLPDARFILILKDPVQRAYSAYHMMRTYLNLTTQDMSTLFKAEMEQLKANECLFNSTAPGSARKSWNDCYQCLTSCAPHCGVELPSWPSDLTRWWESGHGYFNFIGKGMYAAQLSWWLSLFKPSQFHVFNSADMMDAPLPALNKIMEFLGQPAWTQAQFDAAAGSARSFHISKDMEEIERNRALLEELYRFFEPHNQQLYQLLPMMGIQGFRPFAGSVAELLHQEHAAARLPAVPLSAATKFTPAAPKMDEGAGVTSRAPHPPAQP